MEFDIELDLLSEEEILEKINGKKNKGISPLSDLSIVFGGSCLPSEYGYVGDVWTKTRRNESMIRVYDHLVQEECCRDYRRYPLIKPVIRNIDLYDKLYKNRSIDDEGIEKVEFGEYPQFAVKEELHNKLENLYKTKSLKETGATYTFDSISENLLKPVYKDGFEPVRYNEYECEGKKYIRVKRPGISFGRILSNGMNRNDKDYFWIEVTPVKWLIDNKTKTLISENALLSGLSFGVGRSYEESFIKKYLDNYMLHDLTQHYYPELLNQQRLNNEKLKYKRLRAFLKLFKKKEKLENKVNPEGVKEVKGHLR